MENKAPKQIFKNLSKSRPWPRSRFSGPVFFQVYYPSLLSRHLNELEAVVDCQIDANLLSLTTMIQPQFHNGLIFRDLPLLQRILKQRKITLRRAQSSPAAQEEEPMLSHCQIDANQL